MKVRYRETVVQWVEVHVDDRWFKDVDGFDVSVETASRQSVFETIQEDGWDGTEVMDTDYVITDDD
jgi:hypothetical protein